MTRPPAHHGSRSPHYPPPSPRPRWLPPGKRQPFQAARPRGRSSTSCTTQPARTPVAAPTSVPSRAAPQQGQPRAPTRPRPRDRARARRARQLPRRLRRAAPRAPRPPRPAARHPRLRARRAGAAGPGPTARLRARRPAQRNRPAADQPGRPRAAPRAAGRPERPLTGVAPRRAALAAPQPPPRSPPPPHLARGPRRSSNELAGGGSIAERLRERLAIDRYLEKLDHEEVLVRRGQRSGLFTFVAVHSTVRGPALGGCRLWAYDDSRAALRDVLRLSRAMTYKAAVADLPLGGGKGVIMADAHVRLSSDRRHAALLDFADTVDAVGGHYITAEDVGTSSRDMSVIAERTRHVAGLARNRGGSGDPSPFTALGVEVAIRACCERVFGSSSLRGRTVCVIGLGHVGSRVAKRCARAGASLVLTDVDEGKRRLAEQLGARWTTAERAL